MCWWIEPRKHCRSVYPRILALFSDEDYNSLNDHVKIEFPTSYPVETTKTIDTAFRYRLDELVQAGICQKLDGYENCYSVRDYLVCVAEESGHEKLIKKLQLKLVASTRRFWHQREYHLSFAGVLAKPVKRVELVELSSSEDVPQGRKQTEKSKKLKPKAKPNGGSGEPLARKGADQDLADQQVAPLAKVASPSKVGEVPEKTRGLG